MPSSSSVHSTVPSGALAGGSPPVVSGAVASVAASTVVPVDWSTGEVVGAAASEVSVTSAVTATLDPADGIASDSEQAVRVSRPATPTRVSASASGERAGGIPAQ
jgi:hypothetical protein